MRRLGQETVNGFRRIFAGHLMSFSLPVVRKARCGAAKEKPRRALSGIEIARHPSPYIH